MQEFKLIVAGGRDFNDAQLMYAELGEYEEDLIQKHGKDIQLAIVSGMARGADRIGYQLAQRHGAKIYEFPAEWNIYGKAAGFMRNREMGIFADGLLAFWDGKSHGTKHMIEFIGSLNKPAKVIRY